MIRAQGLVKRFGGFTTVDGVDFGVSRGEAFGFPGPACQSPAAASASCCSHELPAIRG